MTATLARFRRRHWSLVGALLLGALVVYLVGNNLLPLVDRDEPRFAVASRQMLRSGDWTVPTYLDQLRLKKPILIYWLQATSMGWLGETAFAARLPSSLAGVATLGLLALALPGMVGHRRACWSVFIFATALLPTYLAKVCMTDAVLHLFIAGAMLCLYAAWRGTARWPTLVALGLAIGLAVLTKGPAVLMFLGMTLVVLWLLNKTVDARPATTLVDPATIVPRVFVGTLAVLGLATCVCLPWALAFERRHPGGLATMFATEIVERGTGDKEGHAGPPGFYFVTFWATYFPWCLLWPAALVQGWRRRHLPWVRFSLAAVLGPWLFLEVYRTKLPHYWLPSYPFMAVLTADVLMRGVRARIVDLRDRPFLIGARVWAGAASAAAIVVLAIPFLGDRHWHGCASAVALAVGIGTLAWGVVALLVRRRLQAAAVAMGLGFWAVATLAFATYVPNVGAITVPSRVAARLVAIGATVPGEVQMIGFKEPSLAWYQGGTIRERRDRDFFERVPASAWPRWTVMDDATWASLSPATRSLLVERGTFRGMNLADGKLRETVRVFEKRVAPSTTRSN